MPDDIEAFADYREIEVRRDFLRDLDPLRITGDGREVVFELPEGTLQFKQTKRL